MNFYQDELTAQYNRQRVKEEFEQIRLDVHKPNIFTHIMHSVAGWMIKTGKELHTRYEIPTPHHHTAPSSSFAR